MDIIDILYGEHGMLLRILEALEEYEMPKQRWDTEIAACRMAARLMRSHADMEDELLFPALVGRSDYATVVLEDHKADHFVIRKLLREAERPGSGAPERLRELATAIRNHFEKEEGILFPMMRNAIPRGELEKLGEATRAYRRMEKYRKAPL
jgi:hemerythrin-like domain-containing protein